MKKLVIFILGLILLSGCSSFYRVNLDDMQRQIHKGDKVRIISKSGDDFELKVSSVTKNTIKGEGSTFNKNEISRIEKSKTDPYKTAAVAGGAGAGVTVLGFIGLVVVTGGVIVLL